LSDLPAEAPRPRDVARVLSEIATLMELNGEDAFRSRAFASASRALEGTDADLYALAQADRLTSLRGVGQGIASVIRELVLTGRSTPLEELRAATPIGLFDLMRVPGLGTKRIRSLYSELGVESLDDLEREGRAGRIAELSGFGAKTEQKILEGIAFARASRKRRRYPEALEAAVRLLEWLRSRPGVAAAEIVGALRRRMEVVDRVDLLAATDDAEGVREALLALNGVREEGWEADVLLACLTDGLGVRLRCIAPERFVAAVVGDTGSDAHLADLARRARERGMKLESDAVRGPDGVPLHLPDEEALYSALGLQYLPPELREGVGEVERAAAGRVPRLVERDDLRGTFHCHTTWSDGKATVAEMAEAARALGWSYLGLADHSRSAAYAGGLTVPRLRQQQAEIDRWNAAHGGAGERGFRVFKGTESDILPDGGLDYPDEVLASFDYVVGSVHSSFGMSEEEMTARVIRAVRHPALTMLGHPTGRLLLTREGYAIDVRAVIDAAAEEGVVVEINANPHRLDLDWRHVGYAAERGVLIAINPDAHSTSGLEHVAFGVNMARKAGLEARQILNCWTLDEVAAYFAERKQKS
jgi:DNA polymerase (family 10)